MTRTKRCYPKKQNKSHKAEIRISSSLSINICLNFIKKKED